MESHFCNYNQALALKKLGFDEDCLGRWLAITEWEKPTGEIKLQLGVKAEDYDKNQCLAPLKSQVFEWFRKEHNLKGFVEPVEYLDDTPETYMWVVYNECHSGAKQLTFEEAESACIDKLIELVKNK